MSDLVVLNFAETDVADKVLERLNSLQKQQLIDLIDACVVINPEDGDIKIKQSHNLTMMGASTGLATGGLVGMLTGILLLNPLAGLALGGLAGAAMGALSGSLSDYGINDSFIQELGATLEPGTSALFLLVASATADKVIADIEPYKPKVLQTSLSEDQEQQLRELIVASAA